MTIKQKVLALANELGATVDDTLGGRYFTVGIEAPHGHHWAASSTHELVAEQGPTDPRSDVWKDLLDRMSYGVEACVAGDPECEWWDEAEENPPDMRFKTVCKKKGCKEKLIRYGFPGGLTEVCIDCERCIEHCRHEDFIAAKSFEDIAQTKAEREAEDFGE